MFTIVPLELEHIPLILELERKSFADPWTEGMFREDLQSSRCVYVGAFESGALIGYAGLSWVLDEGEIPNIAVAERCRNRGVGRAMLTELRRRALELELTAIYLEVRQSNAPAIALYSSVGFERVGLRRGYYWNPRENAIIMKLVVD